MLVQGRKKSFTIDSANKYRIVNPTEKILSADCAFYFVSPTTTIGRGACGYKTVLSTIQRPQGSFLLYDFLNPLTAILLAVFFYKKQYGDKI